MGLIFSPCRVCTLAKTTGIELVSLQKGPGSEQRKQASFAHRWVECQRVIDRTWDCVDTAAIILACNLVITSHTAVASLAGGLGVPTWMLLHCVSDWRWGLGLHKPLGSLDGTVSPEGLGR